MMNLPTETERARRNLLRCRERLVEMRALLARIPVDQTTNRIMAGCAIEDATTAFCSALSWAWDAQQRAGVDKIWTYLSIPDLANDVIAAGR